MSAAPLVTQSNPHLQQTGAPRNPDTYNRALSTPEVPLVAGADTAPDSTPAGLRGSVPEMGFLSVQKGVPSSVGG